MSKTATINSNDPMTLPCKTPPIIYVFLEMAPLTTTTWHLSLRKLCSHFPKFTNMNIFQSFWQTKPLLTLSNAFTMSGCVTSIFELLSNCFISQWLLCKCYVRQLLPDWKPCWMWVSKSFSSRSAIHFFRTIHSMTLLMCKVREICF